MGCGRKMGRVVGEKAGGGYGGSCSVARRGCCMATGNWRLQNRPLGGSKRIRQCRARTLSHPKNYARICFSSPIAMQVLIPQASHPKVLCEVCWRFSAGVPMSQSPDNRSRSQSRRTRMSGIDRWGQSGACLSGLIMFRPLSAPGLAPALFGPTPIPALTFIFNTDINSLSNFERYGDPVVYEPHDGFTSQWGGQCHQPRL
jgi:hypothetical protein